LRGKAEFGTTSEIGFDYGVVYVNDSGRNLHFHDEYPLGWFNGLAERMAFPEAL
jgi:hypothetical protein